MLTPLKLKSKAVAESHFCYEYVMSGISIPVYEVDTFHGLNQLIGYAKYINRDFGNVYYRGQNKLYPSLMPALLRPTKSQMKIKDPAMRIVSTTRIQNLGTFIKNITSVPIIARDLNLDLNKDPYARYKAEGILQHYGVPTKCIDLVDNLWVALWMGLYECVEKRRVSTYYHYQKREIPLISHLLKTKYETEDYYQYILLLASPNPKNDSKGVSCSDSVVTIDLRKALPSVFLRPHAQHGIVALRKVEAVKSINDYDMAPFVIGIIRIRIDYVNQWLGDGFLLTQENLFPPASMDSGYDRFLSCQSVFKTPFELTQYL